MGPVKEKLSLEYTPPIDGIEIHSFKEWDSDQSVDSLAYHRRGTAGLWTALAALAVAVGVAAAYGYSVVSQHNSELMWLSGRMGSLGELRGRADRFEKRFNDWSTKQASLADQVQKMNADWKSGLDGVRQRAAALVGGAAQRENNELNLRTAALNAHINEIISRQSANQALIAHLESELTSTRLELASAKADYNRELADLREQQVVSQQQVASLNNVLSTDQVGFEVAKNREKEIVQGVSLHLIGTDLAHQKFRGWIWIAANRRRIWVRDHPADLPVAFYPKADGVAYELVVTKVGPEGIAGYLLVPSDVNSQQQDVASNIKSTTRFGEGGL
ncbi:MAG: hypothetical protein EPN47_03780 [Acidobacteria bacterium]|nr:MAG: hypothetical protein EPN47_03780 [Acidobacteriota bacterium]